MKNQINISRLTAGLFAILLVIGLASCGKSDNQTSDMKNMDKKNSEYFNELLEKKFIKEVSNKIDSSDIGPVYTCPMHPEVMQNYPGTCPKCKMDLVKKEDQSGKMEGTVYTCPMDPQVLANYAGKCPLCKMDLEEMHGDEHKHMDK